LRDTNVYEQVIAIVQRFGRKEAWATLREAQARLSASPPRG